MIRLSDAFIPSVYGSYTALDNPENSQFVQAGVISAAPLFEQLIGGTSKLFTVPFWKDIDPTIEPNYSNDDPADLSVPYGIGSGTMTARKTWVNQSFGEMDLVAELAGSDPLEHIKNRFGTYWTRVQERRLIASCVGILADNIANDNGDMLNDISAAAGAAGVFGPDAFIDAAFQLGDNSESIQAIAVHSMIMARMVKADEIVYIQPSNGGTRIATYKGRSIVVDDNMPVTGTGAAAVYTSILFGTGAFGFGGVEGHVFGMGEGVPKVGSWVHRIEEAGNGGGSETIGERKTWMLHPFGWEWVEAGAAMVEFSPTYADLRLAGHWNRVVSRKQAPIAFIKSRAA